MKPDCAGIWEWFDDDGTKRLVEVFDVAADVRKVYPAESPHFRVYWWGGYYNVNDETDPQHPEYDEFTKAEWPDRWGNRIGDNSSLPEEQLYIGPTPEQRIEIIKQYDTTK
jgi:hypothetical protein